MQPVVPEPRPVEAQSVVFAKDQPEYLQLPANANEIYVESKWQFSWRERLLILLRGTLYLTVMTFGEPLQPIRPSVSRTDTMDGNIPDAAEFGKEWLKSEEAHHHE